MKGIDIFCASEAATAIRQIMDEASSSSTIHLGSSRAIDRYNPIIRDTARTAKPPCSSTQPPITPKTHRKKSYTSTKTSNKPKPDDQKRKSSGADPITSVVIKKGWGCTKPTDFISPASSSRYLLNDKVFFDFDPVFTVEPSNSLPLTVKKDDPSSSSSSSSSSIQPSSSTSPDQVVVLRVSLHCKGCERKMRKHISRMQGVTSFNIDFAAKKVTVVGDVTPLSVLASVSKVKNAQLLTPPVSSSLPSGATKSTDFKKYNGLVV